MGRYRLPDGQLIPNFSGAKNPFHAKNLPSQERLSPATGVTAKAASTQAAPSSSVSFPHAPRAGVGRTLSALRRVAARVAILCRQAWGRVREVSSGLIARLRFGRNRPAVTLASPLSAGVSVHAAVQAELSLENVRVVRNDLTDTDYEVVRAETATASPIKPAPQVMAKPSPAPAPPRSLGRLAERLFSQKNH
jgi:hypothetical protein